MEYTDGQRADFKERFKKLRRRLESTRMLVVFLAFIWIVLDSVTNGDGSMLDLYFGAVPAIFLTFVVTGAYAFLTWRCPACRKPLGGTPKLKFCSMCGVRLAD